MKLFRLKERLKSLSERESGLWPLAKKVGVNRNTLAGYQSGQRQPVAEIIYAICDSCNVSADWLLGLSEFPTPEPDMQSAHELTGLSEKALTNIHNLAKSPACLAGLEYLLANSHIELTILTARITKYLLAVKKLDEKPQDEEAELIDITIPLKDGNDVLSLRDTVHFRKDQAVKSFEKLIDVEG